MVTVGVTCAVPCFLRRWATEMSFGMTDTLICWPFHWTVSVLTSWHIHSTHLWCCCYHCCRSRYFHFCIRVNREAGNGEIILAWIRMEFSICVVASFRSLSNSSPSSSSSFYLSRNNAVNISPEYSIDKNHKAKDHLQWSKQRNSNTIGNEIYKKKINT